MLTMTPISILCAFLPLLPLLSGQPIAQHPCLGPGAAPASSLPPPTSAAQLDPSIAAVIQSFSEQLADVNDKLASLEAKTETVTETTTTLTTLETTATVTETTAVPTTLEMTQTVTETTGEPTTTPTPAPTPAATPLDSATADSLPGNAALVATPEEDPAPAPAPASEPASQPAPAPASEPAAAGESGGGGGDGKSSGSQSGVSDADKMNPPGVVSADNPMAKAIVERHNSIRARFGAQPLKWDDKLAQDAFKISRECIFDHKMNMPNSGQNLMVWPVGSDKQSPEDRIKMPFDWWTLEGRFWGKGTTQVTGHFKTVVRMGQTQIGCGWNTCDGKSGVFFCNYDAAGAPIGDEIPEPKEQINWEADYAHGYDCDSDGGEVFTCIQKVAVRTLAVTDTSPMPLITPAPSPLAW